MAQLLNPFDATQYAPDKGGVSGLPVSDQNGWPVVIIASEIKETAAGDGGYLSLTVEIIDGPNKGATGFLNLNLYNKSTIAVEIANAQLSALSHVTGVFQIQNSEQLHNIPWRAVVKTQKNDASRTEIKGILGISGNKPGEQPAQATNSGFGQAVAQPATQSFTQPNAQQFTQPAQQPAQQPAAQWQQQPAEQQVQQPAVAQQPAYEQGTMPSTAAWNRPKL